MRRFILNAATGLVSLALIAAGPATPPSAPARAPLDLSDPLRDKTLYLFRLIDRTPDAWRAIVADPDLSAVRAGYLARIEAADRTCAAEAACYSVAARLTPDEVATAERALRRLYAASPAVRRLTDQDVAASGAFASPDAADGADLLASAWREQAQAMGRIIDIYAAGVPPLAPLIDSPADDPRSAGFSRRLRTIGAIVLESRSRAQPFFAEPAAYAELLLSAEGRDEAGRHEPLETGENAAARQRMATVDWRRYPYSVILVPGAGPDREGERLTATGRLRLQLALARYHAGKAPFIVVSGGYVHPARTPYAEAIEMKRYLIETLKVPANAILVDPHARHTTTNIRNTARLLYRYGAPLGMKGLIVTDEGQAAYIAAPVFDERNQAETGVVPYSGKAQVGRFEVEFMPSVEALRLNPLDPLDP